MDIGKVAAPTAGNADFLARCLGVIDDDDGTAAPAPKISTLHFSVMEFP
jgi:hypothetical protein